MITITAETWHDMISNRVTPGLFEQFREMAIKAISAGIPVMITDVNGQNIMHIKEQDGKIVIVPMQ